MLPLLYAALTGKPAEERSRQALAAVGLADRAHHRPNQLSGGQRPRVAITRSLVMGPALLLADEPTGNLDTRTSLEVMAILQELHAAGITILIVTHEPDVAAFCERIVSFQDGQVVEDRATPNPRLATGSRQGLATIDYNLLLAHTNQTNRTAEDGMTLIVAIALLMGGASIVNVMLIAVWQRRREIGLRMAVGAQHDDVLRQFPVEATTLSLTGGLLGVLAGFAAIPHFAQPLANYPAWPAPTIPGRSPS